MRDVAYFITLMAMVAVGCSKESSSQLAENELIDSRKVKFTAYSSLLSKAPVVDNNSIKKQGFNVAAYLANSDQSALVKYIPSTHVVCGSDGTTWGYVDENGDPKNYYWPALESQKLSFLAHYPKEREKSMVADDGESYLLENVQYLPDDNGDPTFSFGYTVHHDVDSQFDLIYALREDVLCPPTAPYSVHLPFCHALTQVGFTAELDPNLDVDITVYDVVIHNLTYTGTFLVKNGTDDFNNNGVWHYVSGGDETNSSGYSISEFGVSILNDGNGVVLNFEPQNISDPQNPMMLMPQYISAWSPSTYHKDYKDQYVDYTDDVIVDREDGSKGLDPTKAGVYLAISCEITQRVDGELITINEKENWIYAPLATDITYPDGTLANGGGVASSSDWVAGCRVIYNLKFGGGYTTIPGTEDPVATLTPMTISARVKDWIDVDGGELMGNE